MGAGPLWWWAESMATWSAFRAPYIPNEPRDNGSRDIKLSLITNIESQAGGSQEIIHIHSKYYLQLCELDRKINMLTEKAVSTQICLDLCCLSLWRRLVDWLKSTRTKNGGNLKWAHESGLSAPWKSRMTIVSAKQILASPNIFGASESMKSQPKTYPSSPSGSGLRQEV